MAPEPARGSTYASGPITGFGSIIVNGVRFDDIGASIEDDDGLVRSHDELGLGMRTEVTASAITTAAGVASATASSIRVQSAIVGPLEAINTTQAMLTVLGQTVAVVATTWYNNSITGGIASLTPAATSSRCMPRSTSPPDATSLRGSSAATA